MSGNPEGSSSATACGVARTSGQAYYEVLSILFDSLGVPARPARVVEVGCGSGALSMWLAGRIGSAGEVSSFDLDPRAVDYATREAHGAGRSNARFAVGDVYDLAVAPESADLVVCRHLLCVLKDPARAIRAMVRLLRSDGELVVIEPATEQAAFDPDDARFTRLSEQLLRAFHLGWQRRQTDPKIGLRVPRLLLDAGLGHLRAEAMAQVHLLSDARRSPEHVLDQLATEAFEMPAPTKDLLQRGGFPLKAQREIQVSALERLARLREDPTRIPRSGYVRLMSTQIVAVGRRV